MIPLQKQVFFMSACSIVWTGYLSYASNLATDNKKAERSNRAGSKACAAKKEKCCAALIDLR